jgi:signal peptidase I
MTTLLFLVAFLVAEVLLSALFLWVGARWVKAGKATFRRALAAIFLIALVGLIAPAFAAQAYEQWRPSGAMAVLLAPAVLLVGQVAVNCLIVRDVMKTSTARAFLAWLVSAIPGVVSLAGVFLIVKPLAVEACVIPSNSMAPTLVGWHRTATCPHCGQTLFVPAPPPYEEGADRPDDRERWGICGHCLKTGRAEGLPGEVVSPDRFIANKLLTPRRWDLVVVRLPENPSLKTVRRLVGLPGEAVSIQEGAVWVNGSRLTPPGEVAGLQYNTELRGSVAAMGLRNGPLRLKEDEYCLLGDFSSRSVDSRVWGPVPRSSVEGVVTICYWPVNRWRVWR